MHIRPLSAILFTLLWAVTAAQAPSSGKVKLSQPIIDETPDPDDDDWDPPDADLSSRGNGCKPGTIASVVAQDNSFMTLIFDSFIAEVGPTASHRKRAFCNVNFTISSPGWTFDVQNVDFRGYYNLDKGVNVTIRTAYKFIGQKGRGRVIKTIDGPVTTDFLLHKNGDTALKVDHAGCTTAEQNTTLRIRLSALLASSNSTADGFVQGDSTDGRFKQLLNIGWKKC